VNSLEIDHMKGITMNITHSALLSATVDELARVNAEIADIKERAGALRQLLIDSDETLVVGSEHQAAISLVAGRITTDWKSVAERLGASRQLIAAHSSRGEDYVVVRISARSTETADA
jgi:hypothetical protein